MRVAFTHCGWFGVCPVYMADIDGEAPVVHPRHILLAPLFWLSEALFALLSLIASGVCPQWEPVWPLRVTAELRRPLVREYPDAPEQL